MTTPPFQADHPSSFPLFDWLRFVLASVVALAHEGVITWEGPSGNLAVQVFFALSGWLIGGILLRTAPAGLPRFFFNRGTRIWLPYIAAVIAIYGLSAARDPINDRYFEFLFYDLTFTHNWFIEKIPPVLAAMPLEGTGAGFWSIAVEEQFYLAAPLLIVLTPWGNRLLPWVLIAAICYVSRSWYGSISLGVLAAVVQKKYGNWHLHPIARAALIAAAVGLGFLLFSMREYYMWVAPPFALAVVLATAIEGGRSKIGVFLGGMSYPLYLNHWMGMFAANAIAKVTGMVPDGVRGLLAYALALVAASIAYILIDRNVQKQRGKVFTPTRGRRFTVVAYSLMAIGALGGTFWFGTGWV